MRADEPDINDAIGIVDPNHDTIFVAGDVEDSAAILEDAGAATKTFMASSATNYRRPLITIGLKGLLRPRRLPIYVVSGR